MSRWQPTKLEVLRAVQGARFAMSAYIADQLTRDHFGTRWPTSGRPTAAHVRRLLNELALDGQLSRSAYPSGSYGYTWTLTDAGLEALADGGAR